MALKMVVGVNEDNRIAFVLEDGHQITLGYKFSSQREATVASSDPAVELLAQQWADAWNSLRDIENKIGTYKRST